MALINCPECKKEVSSFAKYCPNCGFSLEIKTSLRIELNLSNEDNIFNLLVFGIKNGRRVVKASHFLWRGKNSIEATFYGDLDSLQLVFEEHLTCKGYNIDLDAVPNDEYVGIRCTEKRNPHDEPTYAGDYIYFHPDVEIEFVEFDSIVPKSLPKVEYR